MVDDDGWDDAEWDRWMKLSDAEQEAELRRVEAEYDRWVNAMTPARWYAYQRRSWLDIATRARLFLRARHGIEVLDEITRDRLRRAQRTLVKLRIFRTSGVWPGEA